MSQGIVPNVLAGVGEIDMSVTVMGQKLAVSEQFFGSPLAVIASGHEQSVPIF